MPLPNRVTARVTPTICGLEKEIYGQENNGGFDVVIGNPPYVKEYTNRRPFEDVKKTGIAKYYEGKMDVWYIFACRAIDLLKNRGCHSFIATNNWITSSGASILRNKILKETKIIKFVDFADFRVFENASIQTMVYVLKKERPRKSYKVKYTKVVNKKVPLIELTERLNYEVRRQKKLSSPDYEWFNALVDPKELRDKTFTFLEEKIAKILNKIEKSLVYKLKEKDVAQGIVSPQDFVIEKHLSKLKNRNIKKEDGIFVLRTDEVKNLGLNPNERIIIKPYYTTKQLYRFWGDENNTLWIIYSDINVRKNINNYPHIKSHLDKFKEVITSDFKPYGLHRAREQKFFEGEKIISLRKTREPHFTYTNFSCYVSQTYFIIKPKDINLKYLTAILNSGVIYFWLYYKGKKQGDQLQIDKEPLLSLPLIKLNFSNPSEKAMHDKLVSMVNKMLELQKKFHSVRLESDKKMYKTQIDVLDNQIDLLVYKLYGLTEEEINIIKSGS